MHVRGRANPADMPLTWCFIPFLRVPGDAFPRFAQCRSGTIPTFR